MNDILKKFDDKAEAMAYVAAGFCANVFAAKASRTLLRLDKELTKQSPGVIAKAGAVMFSTYIGHAVGTFAYRYVVSLKKEFAKKLEEIKEFEEEKDGRDETSEA